MFEACLELFISQYLTLINVSSLPIAFMKDNKFYMFKMLSEKSSVMLQT